MRRDRTVLRIQRQAFLTTTTLVKNLNAPLPALPLAVVDFPKVEHLPVQRLALGHTPLFKNAPVPVLLPVFPSSVAL